MLTMRAAVAYAAGEPLVIEDVQLDAPESGEVLVRVAAGGVCRSDWHVMHGDWPLPMPIVLGHEAAGTVEDVGPNVRAVQPGDPVILSFAPFCGRCARCLSGSPHLCSTMRAEPGHLLPGGFARLHKNGQRIYHFAGTASFAEFPVVHESCVIPIHRDVPLEMAALVGCSVTTGVGAVINTARVTAGSSVAVIGCGGVGLNVIQGARLVSAGRIIAVDVRDESLAFARRFGATDTVNARADDAVAAIRDLTGGGADYAFEALGTAATIRSAVDAARPGGMAVLVGMTAIGEEARLDAFTLTHQEKTVKGCFYGSARTSIDMPMLVRLAQAGRLDVGGLVTRRSPLAEINQAYAALASGAGRGLVVFDREAAAR